MPDIGDILRANLTEPQRLAASDDAAEVLALACAGSGKSRTLAFRIAWLLARGASAESIVAFTFTEKAADAIKLRVSEALAAAGIDMNLLGRMYIGTIHGYCQYVLGQMDARYRQFEVLDENRLRLYLNARFYDLGLATLQPRANGRWFETIEQVASAWMIANEELIDLDAIRRPDAELGEVLTRLARQLGAVYKVIDA